MEDHYNQLIQTIGEDVNREGLKDTPKRAAEAFKFLTSGYEQNIDEVLNGALFKAESDDLIIVKNIELYSLCEHHLLPFFGKCHVGYLPSKHILGLSKVARLVDVFARRLQVQENLTKQISAAIEEVTGAIGVGVIIEARHLCMMMRGVEKQDSCMITSSMLGAFRDNSETRNELLKLIRTCQ